MQNQNCQDKMFNFDEASDENMHFILPLEYQIQHSPENSDSQAQRRVTFDVSKNKCHLIERQGGSLTGIFFDEGLEDGMDSSDGLNGNKDFSIDIGIAELHNSKILHSIDNLKTNENQSAESNDTNFRNFSENQDSDIANLHLNVQTGLEDKEISHLPEKIKERTEFDSHINQKSIKEFSSDKKSFFHCDDPLNEVSNGFDSKIDRNNINLYGCKQDFSLDEELKESDKTNEECAESDNLDSSKGIKVSYSIPFIEAESCTDVKLSKALSDYVSKIKIKTVEDHSKLSGFKESIDIVESTKENVTAFEKDSMDEKVEIIRIGSIKNNPFILQDKKQSAK